MPKGNPRPVQTEKFKQGWFKPQGEVPPGEKLAAKMLAVRVTESVDTAIRALPEMSAWLRRVITEAARRELLGGNASAPPQLTDNFQAEPDRAELVQIIDDLLAIPKLPASTKRKLVALKERLSP